MKYHINRNADREDYDRSEMRAEMEEQMREKLIPVCGHWNYEEFKEWIEENNYALYWNDGWINTATRKVISIETLYQLYATKGDSLKIQEIL